MRRMPTKGLTSKRVGRCGFPWQRGLMLLSCVKRGITQVR